MSAVRGSSETRPSGYESRDISGRTILLGGAALFAAIGISLAVVGLVSFLNTPSDGVARLQSPVPVSPAPRLEISPVAGRAAIEARAMAKLSGYGWTDRAGGRVHLPITRAMEILAKEGWPQVAPAPDRRP